MCRVVRSFGGSTVSPSSLAAVACFPAVSVADLSVGLLACAPPGSCFSFAPGFGFVIVALPLLSPGLSSAPLPASFFFAPVPAPAADDDDDDDDAAAAVVAVPVPGVHDVLMCGGGSPL